jgi:hypothetical protein
VKFESSLTTAPPEKIPQQVAKQTKLPSGQNPTIPSLFAPPWERGILFEAVNTPVHEGDIDVAATVELIARACPLQEPPREMNPSVSKGCQLLIDTGIGMRPFGEDALQLTSAIRHAVGGSHTSVFTFVDCPSNGVLNEKYESSTYTPPANGAVVLVVSDLCRGGPRGAIREADPADWLVVAKRIRDAGSSLVVLNPYPPDRWPNVIVERIPVLYWDRTTQTSAVRRARRMRRA